MAITQLDRKTINHTASQHRRRLSVETDSTKVASLFIYLNKTCFNGLYRVNRSGSFNVPMGDYATPPILDEANLRAASRCLQGAEIVQREFAQIKLVTDGFYYLDPPYHETYNGYSGKGFGEKEHVELADTCREIDEAGGHFMLSNSDTSLVRRLYKGYNIEEISASRSVSCKAHQRGKTNELLIRNYH
jgi:DNA adenine methylase